MVMNDPEIGKSVDACGVRVNYLEEGEGYPVVLLHGSGPGVTAYANWRFVMPVLARNFRVIAPDIVGFGYTERPADVEYSLDYWIEHLVAFLDAVQVEKAHFVGNSFGGGLTLALAARHPDRVGRIVLMGSAGVGFEMTPGLELTWGYQPSMENMRELLHTFACDTSIVTDALVKSRYEASIRPGFQEAFSSLFPPPRQRHIQALATPEEDIKRMEHQVLIFHGRDDKIIPLSSSLKLHSLLANSDLHVFGQCGHWTQIERKDMFAKMVGEFFAKPD